MHLQPNRSIKPEEQISNHLFHSAINLLKELIATPSFSGEESYTATLIQCFLQNKWVETHRKLHNVWAFNRYYDSSKSTILLNSHHDTVKPNLQYTRDPFSPVIAGDKLFGLGSNKAGGSLISLLISFLHFYNRRDLPFNLCFAATAEKETSGENGLRLILPELGRLDFAIIGEPTLMNMAIAEQGLMLLDCVVTGDATSQEDSNAIYKAIKAIQWFENSTFPKVSDRFGPVKMSVVAINERSQGNILYGKCSFTVKVRLTDAYTPDEILQFIRKHVNCTVTPRDLLSVIDADNPVVHAGMIAGCNTYGSPATADQALLNIPSVKLGPGDSDRSHMPDEFIHISEIQQGIKVYTQILEMLIFSLINNPSGCDPLIRGN